MDLSDLRIFQTVVAEGGVTRAAEKLHRVQSNITTRVRQLEEELGVALFLREGKRLHLAPAGRILLGYAERLLDLAAEAREAVQDATPRGVLRLGSMESTAAVRLPGPLTEYHRRYPAVTLELKTGNPRKLATMLLAGEIDVALAAEPIPPEPFEKLPIYHEEVVIVGAADHPPITDDPASTPATMLAFEPGCPHRARFEEWYARRGQMPERLIEIASFHTLLGCALVGMGASLIPKIVLETFPGRDRLSLHALPPGLDRITTTLFWRKGANSPKIAALAEILTGGNRTE